MGKRKYWADAKVLDRGPNSDGRVRGQARMSRYRVQVYVWGKDDDGNFVPLEGVDQNMTSFPVFEKDADLLPRLVAAINDNKWFPGYEVCDRGRVFSKPNFYGSKNARELLDAKGY